MENDEKLINVIKAIRIHYLGKGSCKDCPYFEDDYCVDKLIICILELHNILEVIERIYKEQEDKYMI